MSEMEGIFNLYNTSYKISSINYHGNVTEQQTISNINTLFDDFKMKQLSETRYKFGLKSKYNQLIINIKRYAKSLSKKPAYKTFINITNQSIRLAKTLNPSCELIPELSIQPSKNYSPPILSLDSNRFQIIDDSGSGDVPVSAIDYSLQDSNNKPILSFP
jgi:hypothetical protein